MPPSKSADRGDRLRPHTTISVVAMSPLMNELSPIELVVYLRLVAMSATSRRGRIAPRNADLYPVERSCVAAVRALQERKLVRVEYTYGDHGGRMIEVLR